MSQASFDDKGIPLNRAARRIVRSRERRRVRAVVKYFAFQIARALVKWGRAVREVMLGLGKPRRFAR